MEKKEPIIEYNGVKTNTHHLIKRDTNCPRIKPTMKAITNPNTEMPDKVDGFTRVTTCF